jgi:hypothetical protein
VFTCGRQPDDPHHLGFAQPRALGRKVSDEFTVRSVDPTIARLKTTSILCPSPTRSGGKRILSYRRQKMRSLAEAAGLQPARQTFRYAPLSAALELVRTSLDKHEIATIQTLSFPLPVTVREQATFRHARGRWYLRILSRCGKS